MFGLDREQEEEAYARSQLLKDNDFLEQARAQSASSGSIGSAKMSKPVGGAEEMIQRVMSAVARIEKNAEQLHAHNDQLFGELPQLVSGQDQCAKPIRFHPCGVLGELVSAIDLLEASLDRLSPAVGRTIHSGLV